MSEKHAKAIFYTGLTGTLGNLFNLFISSTNLIFELDLGVLFLLLGALYVLFWIIPAVFVLIVIIAITIWIKNKNTINDQKKISTTAAIIVIVVSLLIQLIPFVIGSFL